MGNKPVERCIFWVQSLGKSLVVWEVVPKVSVFGGQGNFRRCHRMGWMRQDFHRDSKGLIRIIITYPVDSKGELIAKPELPSCVLFAVKAPRGAAD